MAKITRLHTDECAGGGTCSCPWRLDYRPLGLAGPRKRIEFPTKKSAEKHLAATSHKVSRGEYIAPEQIPTFGLAAAEFLRDKAGRHPATVQAWRTHLKHLAAIESVRLDRIDVATIERIRDDLRTKLGARTVSGILTTAGAVFKLAIRRGYAASNPAAIAERPRRAITELNDDETGERDAHAIRPDEVFSSDQIRKLLDAAEPGLYRTLFATVAATGLRPEELYALRWSDISLGAEGAHGAQLSVRRSLSWSRGLEEQGHVRPKFYEPKTKSGYRTLPLPAALVTMLKVWKVQSPRSEYDLVFSRVDGQPLIRSTVLRQGLHPALRRAKLPAINVKTLRHSYASGLIAAGAPITEVQHRLGHSNPAMTLRVYSHWFRDTDTGAADRFAAGFLGASSVPTSVPTMGSAGVNQANPKTAKLLRK